MEVRPNDLAFKLAVTNSDDVGDILSERQSFDKPRKGKANITAL
jgi:hypothetical protein